MKNTAATNKNQKEGEVNARQNKIVPRTLITICAHGIVKHVHATRTTHTKLRRSFIQKFTRRMHRDTTKTEEQNK